MKSSYICYKYFACISHYNYHSQGLKYPDWAKGVRKFWNKGVNRVIVFWFTAIAMTIVVSTAISTDYLDWDRISRDFMPTNELSRALLASFILVMDLMIVMQVSLIVQTSFIITEPCDSL